MPQLTEEHKEAMATGRQQARAIRNYLHALEARKSQEDLEDLEKRHHELMVAAQQEDDPLEKVKILEERGRIEKRIDNFVDDEEFDMLEKKFMASVPEYSERKGISYRAWRKFGVPAEVLRDAGLAN